MSRFVRACLLWLVPMLACLGSCSSTSKGVNLGVVGRVIVDGPPEHRIVAQPDGSSTTMLVQGFPFSLVAYNGETLVAWGSAGLRAELYFELTGADIYPPGAVSADTVLVRDRPSKLEWRGSIATRQLPSAARIAFKPGEAELWGVTFFDPSMPPPDPAPELDPDPKAEREPPASTPIP